MTVKCIVCCIGKSAEIRELSEPWLLAKEVMGGSAMIQIIKLDDGVEVYCDEDGIMKGLQFNRALLAHAKGIDPTKVDFIVKMSEHAADPGELGIHRIRGNFVLTRNNPSTGKPKSLTGDELAFYLALMNDSRSVLCRQCGDPRASPAQIYCGAGCSARAEAKERPLERELRK